MLFQSWTGKMGQFWSCNGDCQVFHMDLTHFDDFKSKYFICLIQFGSFAFKECLIGLFENGEWQTFKYLKCILNVCNLFRRRESTFHRVNFIKVIQIWKYICQILSFKLSFVKLLEISAGLLSHYSIVTFESWSCGEVVNKVWEARPGWVTCSSNTLSDDHETIKTDLRI